ncbi:DUF2892 domain-containing protein [Methylophaga sp.]|uniref:YgaP family membrane protein n=1 Tax=Methylophaga sp. TaxID=2024840 RepID=UPI003A9002B4
MKKNLATWDRWCRIIIGIVIMAYAIYDSNWWWLLGVALLFNAFTGRCLAYRVLGLSTCQTSCRVDTESKKS